MAVALLALRRKVFINTWNMLSFRWIFLEDMMTKALPTKCSNHKRNGIECRLYKIACSLSVY